MNNLKLAKYFKLSSTIALSPIVDRICKTVMTFDKHIFLALDRLFFELRRSLLIIKRYIDSTEKRYD
ncbi:MAG: hypothetical protein AAF298_25790 [Cyanobacteria bacterium P01_A01_bin.40]